MCLQRATKRGSPFASWPASNFDYSVSFGEKLQEWSESELTSFDGTTLQVVGEAVNLDPFNLCLIADQDLVFVEFQLLAIIGDNAAFAGD